MLISQLAKEVGLPIATIRFYEKKGLFSSVTKEGVTTNNYAYYDEEVIDKLQFIHMAKAVGFTLSEIKDVIDVWYEKQWTKQARLEVLNLKLKQLEVKMNELKAMKKQLARCKLTIENE